MLTRQGSRDADKKAIEQFCIPSLILMENAGRSCAESLIWHSHHQPRGKNATVVLCGPGNNGGDGFVIARHLYIAGEKVKVVLFRSPEGYTGDAERNLVALSRFRMPIVEVSKDWSIEKLRDVMDRVGRQKSAWVVDAMLGTGATGEPRGQIQRAIKIANELEVRRFAVDIPTGLDCDTGVPSATTFRADLTCTFIDQKVGFENQAAQPFIGQVLVTGIGAPAEITG